MTPTEIRPERAAWRALSDVERTYNSPEVARAAIAYARANDRTRRAILAVVGGIFVLVPLVELIAETATHGRGWPRFMVADREGFLHVEMVALFAAFAGVKAVMRLPMGSLRRQLPDRLATVVAARPADVPDLLEVPMPRRWWDFGAGIVLFGYLIGLAIWHPARSVGRNLLYVGIAAAIAGVVSGLIRWRLRREIVLLLAPRGVSIWLVAGERDHRDERVVLPWWQISGITPEPDAVVIVTNSYIPTDRHGRPHRHRSPLEGPQSVPGGYRIVLTDTGVRPETVCWVAEALGASPSRLPREADRERRLDRVDASTV